MSEFPPMDLQTFFYSLIGFTALMGFRAWQKMGRTYLDPDAKSRNNRRGEDEFFRWLIVVTVIAVLVFSWYA
ncbi:MAG: hypothetical protein FJW47_05150 [Actinobacteria bacterium]|nr:hypothetical protein [Actinomycetota bacterium]